MDKSVYPGAVLWQMGLLILSLSYLEGSTIGVPNGQRWGNWQPNRICPSGSQVYGFSLKVEPPQGSGDDTALNGIRLLCKFSTYTKAIGDGGIFGTWTPWKTCSSGYLDSFQLRVESPQGNGDDTAANNMNVHCTNGQTLYGKGLTWGTWGRWSARCTTAVCGFQIRTESTQGSGDDTSLNDVRMICC